MGIYTKFLVEEDESYTYASYTPAEFLDSIVIEGFFNSDKKQVLIDAFTESKTENVKDFLKSYIKYKRISLNKDEFKICEAIVAGLLEVCHAHYEPKLWKNNLENLSKNDFENFIAGVAMLKGMKLVVGSGVSNMLNLIEEYRADKDATSS